MSDVFSSLSVRRSMLTRRLTLQAIAGLSAVVVLASGLVLLGIRAFRFKLESAAAGHWAEAGMWLVFAAAAVVAARACAAWLHAPDAPPEGILLSRRVAKSLHRKIDRMGSRFGGVRVDAVWVTGDMNAAILQRPRWGLVGPMQTHLLIGLPLAHSISHRQLSAILAHEFAHLVVQRKGLAAWGCHLRSWWFRVIDRFVESVPRVGAVMDRLTTGQLIAAMKLARMEEFEADEIAAQIVGADLVAETLVEIALKERFLTEDYWRRVMEQSEQAPVPLIRPYRDMGHGMLAGFRRPSAREGCFDSLFTQDDESADVHPSLHERLAALGAAPVVSRAGERSAAVRHLSPLLPSLSRFFDRQWWVQVRPAWRERYRYAGGC